ncbi:DUF5696 domain-containing protein [Lederbergia graminis]|uniref:DUF5696 domain-containing protein n=1 Tax=Lederbergia graminis TaxID=735518 RepID=A0ABW0LMY6_9BACI|nr:DUF5696 domain-containing protein [Paenibacillus bovis]
MQIKKWTLVMVMLIMIAGCSSASTSTSSIGYEDYDLAVGEPISSRFQDQSLPGMKGIAESSSIRLFIEEETGVVAIVDKNSGKTYYTNPPERDLDALAMGVNKDILNSQIRLNFYNQFGQLNNMNSYSDSVAYEQISYEPIDQGIRINYKFGTNQRSAEDLPMLLSYERFEELSNQMDNAGKRALTIGYKENKEKEVYERNDSALSGMQLQRALEAFDAIGYSEEDLAKDAAEHGITQEQAGSRTFLVSIEYKVDNDSLVVRIPIDSIKFPADYPIHRISALSFLGAAGTEEEGSIFVPDGSGALIHFNNGKVKYPAYEQSVFGADQALGVTESASHELGARLPVFGMVYEDSAMLGVIEEGAEVASINADISGRLNSYNYVYPSFIVINKDDVTLDANGKQRSLPKFQQEMMTSDFVVRYKFLSTDQASYQGLAQAYQNYLIEHNGLPERETVAKENSPFYLDLIGALTRQKHFLGIPYKSLESLTTFEDAMKIIDKLQAEDIDNIQLKYSGWFNGGLDQKVPEKVKVDKVIGGSKGLEEFIEYLEEKDIPFYPEVSFAEARSKKGFNEKKEAVRNLKRIPASVYPVDLAINRRDREKDPSYLVKPTLIKDYVSSYIDEVKDYSLNGIALSDLASKLHSDFYIKDNIDRMESKQISVESMKLLKEAGFELMSDKANSYAFPYTSLITNTPMSSSGFKIQDESIPFYQMVVRGFVDYTGEPYNLTAFKDAREYVLKSLEYGAGVHFEWIYKPNHLLKETNHDHLFAVNYELWFDQSVELYHEINEFLKQVQGERLVNHEKLADNVYKSTYENGLHVIVNYNSTSVTVDGVVVKPEGYVIGGEQR